MYIPSSLPGVVPNAIAYLYSIANAKCHPKQHLLEPTKIESQVKGNAEEVVISLWSVLKIIMKDYLEIVLKNWFHLLKDNRKIVLSIKLITK